MKLKDMIRTIFFLIIVLLLFSCQRTEKPESLSAISNDLKEAGHRIIPTLTKIILDSLPELQPGENGLKLPWVSKAIPIRSVSYNRPSPIIPGISFLPKPGAIP